MINYILGIWACLGVGTFLYFNYKFNRMPFVRHCTLRDNTFEWLGWVVWSMVWGPVLFLICQVLMDIAKSE